MKKTKVSSSMSSKVMHVRLGGTYSPGPNDDGKRKVIQDLGQLEQNEKDWADKRARFHGALGTTSAAALAANEPAEAAEHTFEYGSDGAMPPDEPPQHRTFNIPAMSGRRSKTFRHPFLRFVEPAVPFRRHDTRTWKERIEARERAWAQLMPTLTDSYIAWCGTQAASRASGCGPNATRAEAATEGSDTATHVFEVDVVREYEFVPRYRVTQNGGESAPAALARAGLLPCSPQDPSIAVSIDLLDFYYRLRRHAPRLGVQQFVKALCDRHDRPYQRYLRDQFALAFDVFLAIRREVDGRVKTLLKQSEPHWRVKNSCPSCRHKLDGEPDLVIPALFAVDGNFSLKRSIAAGSVDPRRFSSDYRIEAADIDLYANEVKSRTRVTNLNDDLATDDVIVEVLDEPGEPGDDAPPTPCTLRWKAAKADQYKVAPDMFDQTGIYVALCRHGLVLWYCEMRRSGELAKYPLGTFARVMEAGLAPITGAADIGCALQGTLSRSALLGAKARASGLRIRMNSFHGYGHNRLCQVGEHPLYIEGFGLEDMEICERFFSASNHVAGVVRHASPFHYAQFIDLFLGAWDEEKYAALSTFLCNNVLQAQGVINDYEAALEAYKSARGLTDAVIEGWRLEEKAYLESLKAEPEEDILEMDYVEALMELDKAKVGAEAARIELESGFVLVQADELVNVSSGQVAKRLTKKRKAHAAYMAALNNVETLEKILRVQVQWTPESLEYKAALEKIRLRTYMRAVDRLELLLLERMLELTKVHSVGTGYKLREAIGKGIKTRSKAIGTAVKNYNEAARVLVPPAPLVNFATLMEWTESQEFDLLRLARRGDVRERVWAKPVNREVATKYHKIKRAHEELLRCRIEMHRLVTAIRDEDVMLTSLCGQLEAEGHALAGEVTRIHRRRAVINALHLQRFRQLASTPGYSAFKECLVPGTREGSVPPASGATSAPTGFASHSGPSADRPSTQEKGEQDDDEDSGAELDDEDAEQLLAVQDFIGHLDT